jgi:hypothetical protein
MFFAPVTDNVPHEAAFEIYSTHFNADAPEICASGRFPYDMSKAKSKCEFQVGIKMAVGWRDRSNFTSSIVTVWRIAPESVSRRIRLRWTCLRDIRNSAVEFALVGS